MSISQADYNKLDAARWISALAVVLLHCAAFPLTSMADYGSADWQWANLYDAAMRWCVPVFVMISGALLLDPAKREAGGVFLRRRAARIVPAILFWTAFYLLWRAWMYRLEGVEVATGDWWQIALSGEPYYHLWYLYMLLGLYLFTPALRLLYRVSTPRQRMGLVMLVFALAMLQSVYRELSDGSYGFFLLWCLPYIGYFMAGRMIFERQFRLPYPVLLLLASIALTALGASVLTTPDSLNVYFYDAFSLTVPWMSLAVFQLVMDARRLPRWSVVAPLTFGIYLVHPVFLDIAKLSGWYAWPVDLVWWIPMTALLVFGFSMACVWLLRRVPGGVHIT